MKKLKINKLIIFLFSIVFSLSILSIGNNLINNNYIFANIVAEQEIQSVSGTEYSCPKSNFASQLELDSFADENKYFYYEDNDYYYFYNKFGLKTIMIEGKFDASKYDNVENLSSTFKIIHFATIEETEQAYNELMKIEGITVTLDRIYKSSAYETSTPMGWGYSAIEAEPYTEYLQQNGVDEEIVVAVIDTGINTSHEMFKNRIVTDGNGNRVGFGLSVTVNSSGYISNMGVVSSYEDDNGHGTHVSGIICDTTPSNVKILPIKCLDANGKGYVSVDVYKTLLQEMIRLKNKYNYNIVSVNMSIGTEKGSNISSSFVSSINTVFETYLINNNILPVVAAGNDSTELSSSYYCIPASCESVVTVSALKQNGSNYVFDYSYSNYGSCVDISAPGTLIKSAIKGGTSSYGYKTGTSMATPYVSAVTALLGLDPIYSNTINASVIKERMFSLAIDLGTSGKDNYYGYGMLSLRNFRGSIKYTATDTTVTYDGNYHNISLTITNATDYTIKYGFSVDAINITNINTNANFKNYTNGQKKVYFKISSPNNSDTIDFAYLQINKAERKISVQDQSGIYGDSPNLTQTKYTLNSSLISGDNLGLTLTTTATNKSPVGNYAISYSYTNQNYKLTTLKSGSYIIKKRDISIKLGNQKLPYGSSASFDSQAYTITSGKLVNNDNLNLVLYTNETNYQISSTYDILVKSYNSNYNLTYTKGKLEITARPITISISQAITYGDSYKLNTNNYKVLSGGVVVGDTLIYSLSTNAPKTKLNAGEYSIQIKESNPNYNITLSSGKLTVNKRNATITIGNQTKMYGDAINLNQQTYNVSNVIANDVLNVTLYTNAVYNSSVGSYYIKANYSNNNYNLTITEGKLTVISRDILVRFYQESTYGNSVTLNNNFTDVNNRMIAGDNLYLSLSTTANNYSNVGDYKVTISSCNANYSAKLTDDSKLKIVPRDATITIGNASVCYGEDINISNVSLNMSQVLSRDYNNLNHTLITQAKKYDSVGNYDIDLTYNNANYNITTIKGTLNIYAKPVTVLVQDTYLYGDEINTNISKYYVLSGNLVNNDNLQLAISTIAHQFSKVGYYNCELYSNNHNYDVTLSASSYVRINARPIKITIGNASSQFGEDIDISKVEIDDSEVLNNDDLGITLTTTATKQSPAGSYVISMQKYTNKNYTVTAKAGTYRIYNMRVHIKIVNQAFIYGNEITLDNMQYEITETGVQKDELNIVLTTNANNKSKVGNYEITLYSNSQNYDVIAENGMLTIYARPIEIKVNQSVIYGNEFVYNGNYNDINKRIVNNDDLNLTLTTVRQQFSAVGTYSFIVASYNENYIVTLSDDSALTVLPRNIEILLGDITQEYKSEIDLSATSIDLSQVLNNDNLNISLTTNATKLSPVGTYSIDLIYENSNYAVSVIKGKYIILPKNVQINVNNTNSVYGSNINLSTDIVNVINEDITVSELNIKLSTLATNKSSVGKYEIDAVSNNSNFNMSINQKGYINITPKSASLKIDNTTFTYGDEIDYNKINYTQEDVLFNDNLLVTLNTDAVKKSPTGDYDIQATCANNNYVVEITKGKLTIVPKTIKITTKQSGKYGDEHSADNNFIDIQNGIIDGDNLGISFSINVDTFANVGNYDIQAEWSNKNYNVILIDSYYEVTPRPIIVTIGNYEMNYGERVNVNQISINNTAVLNNDNLNVNLVYNVNNTTNAGQYEINATYDNYNYVVTFINGKITIKPLNIVIKVAEKLTYGNIINYVNNYEIKSGKLINNDDLSLQVSTNSQTIQSVGYYGLNVKSCNKNYNTTLTADSYLQITPRKISVLVGNAKSEYLSPINLSNVAVDLSQVIQNDDINYTLSTNATSTSDVGYYDIDLTYNNKNYDITILKGSYQITPKPVSIQINNAEVVYGDEITKDLFTFVCEDETINKENVEVVCKINEISPQVGEYDIVLDSNNKNYSINATKGILTVTPRKVTIKLLSQAKGHLAFKTPNQNMYEVTEGVICDGDDLDVEITTTKNPAFWGKYELTGKARNSNYDVTIISGTLSINFSFVDAMIFIVIISSAVVATIFIIKKKKMSTK